jgi:hypothetical protein
MIAWLIIYIIGVLFVGGVSVWYIKEADEDVYLLDLMKLIVMSFFSWLTVLAFVLFAVCLWIEEQCGKVIIRKGEKEDEE